MAEQSKRVQVGTTPVVVTGSDPRIAEFVELVRTGQIQLAIAPQVPSDLTYTCTESMIRLQWTGALGASEYELLKSDHERELRSPGDFLNVTALTRYIDDLVDLGVTYYYAVVATGPGGLRSERSEVIEAMLAVDVGAPPDEEAPLDTPARGWFTPRHISGGWTPSAVTRYTNVDGVVELDMPMLQADELPAFRNWLVFSLEQPADSPFESVAPEVHRTKAVGITIDAGSVLGASNATPIRELGSLADDLGGFGIDLAVRLDG